MGPALLLIAQLYRVEKRARGLNSQDRLRSRQLHSQGILDKLHEYLLEIEVEVLPKSPEGRAVRYTLKNWIALTRFVKDGDLEIDNNRTERAIRGVAVGRNNWVFFGSDQGGKSAAVLRSFVASCQRASVDPFTWLKDVLSRIATHPITRLAELLPQLVARRPGLIPFKNWSQSNIVSIGNHAEAEASAHSWLQLHGAADLALLLSVEAFRVQDTPQARSSILRLLAETKGAWPSADGGRTAITDAERRCRE